MKSIDRPTETYLNNLSDRIEKLWKMMDKTVEKSFQLMETIHKKKSSKVTEPTPKNTETPKTPPKNFPTYRKKDQDTEEDAGSEEIQLKRQWEGKEKNKEMARHRTQGLPSTHPYRHLKQQ